MPGCVMESYLLILMGRTPATVWVDGSLYSSALPEARRTLEAPTAGTTTAEKARRREAFDAREPYRFVPHAKRDTSRGTQRFGGRRASLQGSTRWALSFQSAHPRRGAHRRQPLPAAERQPRLLPADRTRRHRSAPAGRPRRSQPRQPERVAHQTRATRALAGPPR